MSGRPHLRALAERIGVVSEYADIEGKIHPTSDASYAMLLGAMGYPAETEEAAQATLQEIDEAERKQVLQPVVVLQQHALPSHVIRACLPGSENAGSCCRVTITEEIGQTHEWELRVDRDGELRFSVPLELPTGYHQLVIDCAGVREEQSLIVVPDRCYSGGDIVGSRRSFGICANLYTLRGERNWGVGDFADLATLCGWAAGEGAAFVGLNPLHAGRNEGYGISPYSPLSRLYRNVLYLDVTAVPELAHSREAQARVRSPQFQALLGQCRAADRIEYQRVVQLKMEVMHLLHGELLRASEESQSTRREAYAGYVSLEGDALEKFTTFAALESHFAQLGHPLNWRSWPSACQDCNSPAVAEFQRAHAEEISLHKYVQFELDRQLQSASAAARRGGMSIGLYQDLAVGSAPGGADTWAYRELFVEGARVGAPPDDYSRTGQDWGLPPLHPVRLRDGGYRYWRQLLRANMAHSGALRIDHVMGLLRQYWIPPGASALEGAYVRYPAADLFGILALESQRHRAIVIGEDLGTVPAGFKDLLQKYGILSCEVLYFQRDGHGHFKPPEQYSDRALVTSTTHDHPSLASFWRGEDLKLRRRLGILESDEQLESEQRRRAGDRLALLYALGMGDRSVAPMDVPYAELCTAVHRFLSRTPAPLVGVMLDDLTGEMEPINLPGVPPEMHDCWRRRMRMSLEEIVQSPEVDKGLAGAASRAERRKSPMQ